MDCVYPNLLKCLDNINSSKHRSIWTGLLSIGLDLHAPRDPGVGLSPRQVRHVDEGVVERGQDVTHAEHVLVLLACHLRWTVVIYLLFFARYILSFSSVFGGSGLLLFILSSFRLYRRVKRGKHGN